MVDSIVTGLLWLACGATALVWAWCLQKNVLLSWRFIRGESVVFRPVPMLGLIAGFFALITCPALVEVNRLPLAGVVALSEIWAPLGLVGWVLGRRPGNL